MEFKDDAFWSGVIFKLTVMRSRCKPANASLVAAIAGDQRKSRHICISFIMERVSLFLMAGGQRACSRLRTPYRDVLGTHLL